MSFRASLTDRLALLVAAVFTLGCIGHAVFLGKTVYGDGRYYYAILRSAAVDGNLDFRNEYRVLGVSEPVTRAGIPANKYAVGPALVWLPTFLTVHRFVRGTGFEFPYQLAVALTSVGAALTGLLVLYRTAAKLFGTGAGGRATLAIAGATNLWFYGSVDTVNSHAVSFLAAAVVLALTERRLAHAQGGFLGLLALTRPQDALHGVLYLSKKRPFGQWLTIAGVSAAVYLLQILMNRLVYGQWIASGYLASGEGFAPGNVVHILPVLFSPRFGLFVATPIVLVALLGIRFLYRKDPGLARASVILAVGELITVSLWSTWSQGASYGGRMFVSLLPVMGMWLAALFRHVDDRYWRGRYLLGFFVAALAILNLLRIIWFLLVNP